MPLTDKTDGQADGCITTAALAAHKAQEIMNIRKQYVQASAATSEKVKIRDNVLGLGCP